MTEAEAEWWFFILPIATTPVLITLILLFVFVIPQWFKSFEDEATQ